MAEFITLVADTVQELFAAIAWSLGSVRTLLTAGCDMLVSACGHVGAAAAKEDLWLWAALGWIALRHPMAKR